MSAQGWLGIREAIYREAGRRAPVFPTGKTDRAGADAKVTRIDVVNTVVVVVRWEIL